MNSQLIKMIESYDSIIVYRHVYPDMDALGSQFGLALWIQDTYPRKHVYCAGNDAPLSESLGLKMDKISDEITSCSLGIVLDASTAARVDDQRYTQCDKTIRIDHHVKTEVFCDIEEIDEKASATCEMLALILQTGQRTISSRAAQLLYQGLVADNVRFTTTSVRKETFDAAGYLLNQGVDVVACDRINFSSSLEDYQYETKVRAKSKVYGKALVSIMEIEDYKPLVESFARAKEKVYALGGVSSIEIWALFTRMDDGIHYSASLRSRTKDIRQIAQRFGGGGHVCASGIKNLTQDDVQTIIESLKEESLR